MSESSSYLVRVQHRCLRVARQQSGEPRWPAWDHSNPVWHQSLSFSPRQDKDSWPHSVNTQKVCTVEACKDAGFLKCLEHVKGRVVFVYEDRE